MGAGFPAAQVIREGEAPAEHQRVKREEVHLSREQVPDVTHRSLSARAPERVGALLFAVESQSRGDERAGHGTPRSVESQLSFSEGRGSSSTWPFNAVTEKDCSCMTLPTRPNGSPAIACSNAAQCSRATVTTKREALSENSNSSSRSSSSRGIFARSTSIPSPPENADSASATPRPPSEQSWQLSTSWNALFSRR